MQNLPLKHSQMKNWCHNQPQAKKVHVLFSYFGLTLNLDPRNRDILKNVLQTFSWWCRSVWIRRGPRGCRGQRSCSSLWCQWTRWVLENTRVQKNKMFFLMLMLNPDILLLPQSKLSQIPQTQRRPLRWAAVLGLHVLFLLIFFFLHDTKIFSHLSQTIDAWSQSWSWGQPDHDGRR